MLIGIVEALVGGFWMFILAKGAIHEATGAIMVAGGLILIAAAVVIHRLDTNIAEIRRLRVLGRERI